MGGIVAVFLVIVCLGGMLYELSQDRKANWFKWVVYIMIIYLIFMIGASDY